MIIFLYIYHSFYYKLFFNYNRNIEKNQKKENPLDNKNIKQIDKVIMDFNTIAGIIIISTAVSLMTGIMIWSHRLIEKLYRKGSASYRKISKDISNEKKE